MLIVKGIEAFLFVILEKEAIQFNRKELHQLFFCANGSGKKNWLYFCSIFY